MTVKELKEKINSIPEEHDEMNVKIKVINENIGISFGGFSLAAENVIPTDPVQDRYIMMFLYVDVNEPESKPAAESEGENE